MKLPTLFRPFALAVGLMALSTVSALPALAQGATNFGPARPLNDVLDNMEGAPWSAVKLAALQQAEHTLGPVYRNIPATLPYYAAFEGTFIPASNDTRLAIFSDGGCNVWINGELVWNRLNRLQRLPALSQSLHPLDYEMQAGVSYAVRVEFSNTIYRGTTDADGATLFAYTYDANGNRPYVEWRVGTPINSSGIRSIHWPGSGNIVPAGMETVVSAFLATDFDQRDATIEGVVHSGVYSDPCSYTWSADAGSFKNNINTGQSVKWIAPTLAGTYTLTLTVDDQNKANQPVYENGIRSGDVNPNSYDDEARTFTLLVTVM